MNYLISNKGRKSGDSVGNHYYKNEDDSCFVTINHLAPIRVLAAKGMRMHLMLTVGDMWCERAGDGVWFGIRVGNKVVVRNFYTAAMKDQRMPVTLQTLFEAESDGQVDVQAVWCNWTGSGPCHIGEWGDAALIVGVEDLGPSKRTEISDNFSGSDLSNMFR